MGSTDLVELLTSTATETADNSAKYERYQSAGGILERAIFNTITSSTKKALEEQPENPNHRRQALALARNAGINLTLREIAWYKFLRMMPPQNNNPENGSIDPARLGDQKLLAEVFRIERAINIKGATENYNKFTNSYPVIFQESPK